MQMSENEIVKDYEHAKNKRSQIKILSELNMCSQMDIARILYRNGIMPPSPWGVLCKPKSEEVVEQNQNQSVVVPVEEVASVSTEEPAEEKPKFFKFKPEQVAEPEELEIEEPDEDQDEQTEDDDGNLVILHALRYHRSGILRDMDKIDAQVRTLIAERQKLDEQRLKIESLYYKMATAE